jgi:hypothetical protein
MFPGVHYAWRHARPLEDRGEDPIPSAARRATVVEDRVHGLALVRAERCVAPNTSPTRAIKLLDRSFGEGNWLKSFAE